MGVVYNASNNELVRTNTLVKNAIIQVDATPYRQWYEQHYGITLGKLKKERATSKDSVEAVKKSGHVQAKMNERVKTRTIEKNIEDQFNVGRLYACISSRPGQSGRCDGYILEGAELDFYLKKINTKKSKK